MQLGISDAIKNITADKLSDITEAVKVKDIQKLYRDNSVLESIKKQMNQLDEIINPYRQLKEALSMNPYRQLEEALRPYSTMHDTLRSIAQNLPRISNSHVKPNTDIDTDKNDVEQEDVNPNER
jgi:hypothetical protein